MSGLARFCKKCVNLGSNLEENALESTLEENALESNLKENA